MTLTERIRKMREKRAKLITDAGAILTLAANEERDMTAEERERFDRLHGDADNINDDIKTLQRQETAERSIATIDDERRSGPGVGDFDSRDGGHEVERAGSGEVDEEAQRAATRQAFDAWCRFGMGGITPEQRQIMQSRFVQDRDMRAQSVGTDSAGGYTVAEEFMRELDVAQLQFSGMLEASRVFSTSTGADLPWPTTDDTSNTGALLAENTQDTEQDVTFGATTLSAFMYTSKIIRVSLQLIQDSAFNVESTLAALMGERLGRIKNTHCTTGDGSSKPRGVVTAATLGKTTNSATAITYAEIIELKHSVDPAYRRSPATRWMMHDNVLAAVKTITDDQNRPIYLPGINDVGDTIDGDPYTVNNDMASSIATTAKTMLYGDFSKYVIRQVRPVTVLRLTERYADYLQVAFIAFERWDADLIDAGTNPIKFLQQA